MPQAPWSIAWATQLTAADHGRRVACTSRARSTGSRWSCRTHQRRPFRVAGSRYWWMRLTTAWGVRPPNWAAADGGNHSCAVSGRGPVLAKGRCVGPYNAQLGSAPFDQSLHLSAVQGAIASPLGVQPAAASRLGTALTWQSRMSAACA